MLNNALDFGILERDFWDMTIAELDRAIESKKRVSKLELQEKASFDYILSSLIGRAFAASMDSKNELPTIKEAYPTLFTDSEELIKKEEEKQKKVEELSALRFKMFAKSYNNRFKGGGKKE